MNRPYLPAGPSRRTVLSGALAAGAAGVLSTATACDAAGGDTPGGDTPGKPGSPAPATGTSASPSGSARPPSPPADWPALSHSLDGPLIRPGDSAYATARQLYNTRFDGLKPAAVAYVKHDDDIRECLAFARAAGTPTAIRSGGHSYGG